MRFKQIFSLTKHLPSESKSPVQTIALSVNSHICYHYYGLVLYILYYLTQQMFVIFDWMKSSIYYGRPPLVMED